MKTTIDKNFVFNQCFSKLKDIPKFMVVDYANGVDVEFFKEPHHESKKIIFYKNVFKDKLISELTIEDIINNQIKTRIKFYNTFEEMFKDYSNILIKHLELRL